jgi:hypothetical protein
MVKLIKQLPIQTADLFIRSIPDAKIAVLLAAQGGRIETGLEGIS